MSSPISRLTFAPLFGGFWPKDIHPVPWGHPTSYKYPDPRGVFSRPAGFFIVCKSIPCSVSPLSQTRAQALVGSPWVQLQQTEVRAVAPGSLGGLLRDLEHIFIFHFILHPFCSRFSTRPLPSPPMNHLPGELRTPRSAMKPAGNECVSSVTLHGCLRSSHKPTGYPNRRVMMPLLHRVLLLLSAPALLSGGAVQQ